MAISWQATRTDRPGSVSSDRVRAYLPLARRVALRYHQRTGHDHDDLFQVACMGLVRALGRFDSSHGASFESYASATMSGEILHYLRDLAPCVRPPRELVEMRATVRQAFETLQHEQQREPSMDEVARRTALPERKVREVLGLERISRPMSLDSDLEGDDEGAAPRWQLADERERQRSRTAELRIVVQDALERLRPAAREAIRLAYFEDRSQQQIAEGCGVSQTQISRRIRGGLRQLAELLIGCDDG